MGLNPANALQHPGFYYYAPAQGTERRRARFLATLEITERAKRISRGSLTRGRWITLGLRSGCAVSFWREWYSAEYSAERSCTRKRTSFSRSTRRYPMDTVRDDIPCALRVGLQGHTILLESSTWPCASLSGLPKHTDENGEARCYVPCLRLGINVRSNWATSS